jgi:hypothetical protein
MATMFFPSSFVAVVGSGIGDPGQIKIRIRDPGYGIRDKYPKSATGSKLN